MTFSLTLAVFVSTGAAGAKIIASQDASVGADFQTYLGLNHHPDTDGTGTWSYLYSDSLNPSLGATGDLDWSGSAFAPPGDPNGWPDVSWRDWMNGITMSSEDQPAQSWSRYSVMRWTSGITGSVKVSGEWVHAYNQGSMDAAIYANGQPQLATLLEPGHYATAFAFDIDVLPGDILDFVAGPGGASTDGTWDRARISALVTLPSDLVGATFEYQVLYDRTALSQGPWPVNQPIKLKGRVLNQGEADATSFDVEFHLKTKANSHDMKIGSKRIQHLAAGESVLITQTVRLPDALSNDVFGDVELRMLLDPSNEVDESDETNNSDQSVGQDMDEVRLFDPVWGRRPVYQGSSRKDAAHFLEMQGFFRPISQSQIGAFPYDNSSWSKPLHGPVFTRFNGTTVPGTAFRLEASINSKNQVIVQGVSHFQGGQLVPDRGEPDPVWALFHSAERGGLKWLTYVTEYHVTF